MHNDSASTMQYAITISWFNLEMNINVSNSKVQDLPNQRNNIIIPHTCTRGEVIGFVVVVVVVLLIKLPDLEIYVS